MPWRAAPLLVLVLLTMVACTKAVPEETANQVVKDLAVELVKMEDASLTTRMEKLSAVCAKHGVEVKAFAKYVSEHPDVEDRLTKEMAEVFKADLTAIEADLATQVNSLQESGKAALENTVKSGEEARSKLEISAAGQAGELQKKYEDRRKELLKELTELQQQP